MMMVCKHAQVHIPVYVYVCVCVCICVCACVHTFNTCLLFLWDYPGKHFPESFISKLHMNLKFSR